MDKAEHKGYTEMLKKYVKDSDSPNTGKKPTDFLKYGRHVKSEGKPATYKEHISKMKKMAKKAK